MQKIIRLSRFLRWIALSICVSLPLLEAGYWITEGYPFLSPLFQAEELPSFGDIPLTWSSLIPLQKLLGFLCNLLPLSLSMAALIYLARLFSSFESLKLFEKENALILKRAGWALLWNALISATLYRMILSFILTYRNPVGHRMIQIALGHHELAIGAIGLSVLLISWILEEAASLYEEQSATV